MSPAARSATGLLAPPAPAAGTGGPTGPGGPGATVPDALLSTAELHRSLSDPALTSMTLLNEITGRFPAAVSFAAGRPCETGYATGALHRYLDRFARHLAEERDFTEEQVARALFQYGDTKGIIGELLGRHLAVDEGLTVDPESVVVTTGCQEAMVLVLRALRRGPRDVVFAAAPTYVGFTGAARLVDMPVRLVREGPGGLDLDHLAAEVRRARAEGLTPRACYVIPDFANPGGGALPTADRERLLRIAEDEDLLLLEDNPYSMFHDGGPRLPTLKALDRARRVVYLGSFSKTAFPGARIGYLVADQPVREGGLLADQLAKLKSMLTLNTSSVAQAVIGGLLLEHGHSLERASAPAAEVYRRNRRAVVDGLARRFPDPAAGVRWNQPKGGLFAVVTVPFRADDAALEVSADRYGVLWTPMHHFYAGTGGLNQLRLSFSVLTTEEIETGLDRLAAFIADRSA